MKGADLKEKLRTSTYTMAEIAQKIGVSPQNLNASFNSEDVKSGLLEKLSQALEVPLAYFYGDSYNVQGNGNALATGDHSTASSSDDRLLALLMSKDTQLTMSMQQTSKAQEQITELIRMMQK
jgi:transcriptional regulator with XRE-family HTH domain